MGYDTDFYGVARSHVEGRLEDQTSGVRRCVRHVELELA